MQLSFPGVGPNFLRSLVKVFSDYVRKSQELKMKSPPNLFHFSYFSEKVMKFAESEDSWLFWKSLIFPANYSEKL